MATRVAIGGSSVRGSHLALHRRTYALGAAPSSPHGDDRRGRRPASRGQSPRAAPRHGRFALVRARAGIAVAVRRGCRFTRYVVRVCTAETRGIWSVPRPALVPPGNPGSGTDLETGARERKAAR